MELLQSSSRSLATAWRERGRPAGIAVGATAVGMWLLEIVDTLTFHSLDSLGLSSWRFDDLPSLITAPFIHFGFGHLIANTGPFLVFGFLIALSGVWHWLKVTGIAAVTSGLFAFFLSPLNVVTAGASGLVFGYVTYVIARGIISRRWLDLLVGVVVLVGYGSVLWGVFPTQAGVSWQGHLGGAVGGVLAAWLLHQRQVTARRSGPPLMSKRRT